MLLNWEDLLLNPAPVTTAAAAPNPWAPSIVPTASLAPAPQPTPQPQNPGSVMPDWMGSPAISPKVAASIPAMQANYDPFKAFAAPQKAPPKRGVLGESFGTLDEAGQKKWLEDQFSAYETGMRRIKGLETQMANAPSPYARRGLDAILKSERAALPDINKLNEMRDGFAPLPTKTGARTAVENVAKGFTDSLLSVPEFAGIVKGYLKPGQVDDDSLLQWSQGAKKKVEELFPGDAARQNDFSQQLATGLGQIASFYGTGALTALAKAGPKVMAAIIATQGASQTGAQGFTEATQKLQAARREALTTGDMGTVTELDRLLQTAGYAAVGTTEAIPVASTFGRMVDDTTGRFAQRAVGAAEGAVEESLQEAGSQFLQNAIAGQTTDPQRGLGEGVAESAAAGGILGAGAGGLLTRTQQPIEQVTPTVESSEAFWSGQPGEPISFIDLVPGEGYTEVKEPAQLAAPQKALPSPEEPGSAAAGALPAPQPNAPEGGAPATLEGVDAAARPEVSRRSFLKGLAAAMGAAVVPAQIAQVASAATAEAAPTALTLEEIIEQKTASLPDGIMRNVFGGMNMQMLEEPDENGSVDYDKDDEPYIKNPKAYLKSLKDFLGYIEEEGGTFDYGYSVGAGENLTTQQIGELKNIISDVEKTYGERGTSQKKPKKEKVAEAPLAPEEAARQISNLRDHADQIRVENPNWVILDYDNTGVGDSVYLYGEKTASPNPLLHDRKPEEIFSPELLARIKASAPGSKLENYPFKSTPAPSSAPASTLTGNPLIDRLAQEAVKRAWPDKFLRNLKSKAESSPQEIEAFLSQLQPIPQIAAPSEAAMPVEVDQRQKEAVPAKDASARPGADAPRVTPSATLKPELLNKQADALIKSGRTTQLPEELTAPLYSMLEANKELTNGLPTFVLERLEPAGVSESGKPQVRAVFRSPEGEETDFLTPQQDLFNLRAFHSNGRLFFLGLNAAETSSQGLAGKLWHEVLHALRRQGNLPGGDFDRLLGHANDLNILELDYHDFARRTGDPSWADYSTGVTIRELYADLYQGEEDILERLNQEAVAHMLELYNAGALDAAQFEPIQDVLDNMAAGKYAAQAEQGDAAPEPLKPTEVKVYHGTVAPNFDKFSADKSQYGGTLYFSDNAELSSAFAGGDDPYDLEYGEQYGSRPKGSSPRVIPAIIDTAGFKKVNFAGPLRSYEWRKDNGDKLHAAVEQAKAEGHKGLIATGMTDYGLKGTQYVTWTEGTVRSALSDSPLYSWNPFKSKGEAPASLDVAEPAFEASDELKKIDEGIKAAQEQVATGGTGPGSVYGALEWFAEDSSAKEKAKQKLQTLLKAMKVAYPGVGGSGMTASKEFKQAFKELLLKESGSAFTKAAESIDNTGPSLAMLQMLNDPKVGLGNAAKQVYTSPFDDDGSSVQTSYGAKANATPEAPTIKKTSAAVKKAAPFPPVAAGDIEEHLQVKGGHAYYLWKDAVLNFEEYSGSSANVDSPEWSAAMADILQGTLESDGNDGTEKMSLEQQKLLEDAIAALKGEPVAPNKPKQTPSDLINAAWLSLPNDKAKDEFQDILVKLANAAGVNLSDAKFDTLESTPQFLKMVTGSLKNAAQGYKDTLNDKLAQDLLAAAKVLQDGSPASAAPEVAYGADESGDAEALDADVPEPKGISLTAAQEMADKYVTESGGNIGWAVHKAIAQTSGGEADVAEWLKKTANNGMYVESASAGMLQIADALLGKSASAAPAAPLSQEEIAKKFHKAIKAYHHTTAVEMIKALQQPWETPQQLANNLIFAASTYSSGAPLSQDLKELAKQVLSWGAEPSPAAPKKKPTELIDESFKVMTGGMKDVYNSAAKKAQNATGVYPTDPNLNNHPKVQEFLNVLAGELEAEAEVYGIGAAKQLETAAAILKGQAKPTVKGFNSIAALMDFAYEKGIYPHKLVDKATTQHWETNAQLAELIVKQYKEGHDGPDDLAALQEIAEKVKASKEFFGGSAPATPVNQFAGKKLNEIYEMLHQASLHKQIDTSVSFKFLEFWTKAWTEHGSKTDSNTPEVRTTLQAMLANQLLPTLDGKAHELMQEIVVVLGPLGSSSVTAPAAKKPTELIGQAFKVLSGNLRKEFHNAAKNAQDATGVATTDPYLDSHPQAALYLKELAGNLEAVKYDHSTNTDGVAQLQAAIDILKGVKLTAPATTPAAPKAPAEKKAPWPDHFTSLGKAQDFIAQHLPDSTKSAWGRVYMEAVKETGGGLDTPKGKNLLAKKLEVAADALLVPPSSKAEGYPTTDAEATKLVEQSGGAGHYMSVLQKMEVDAEDDGGSTPEINSPEWKALAASEIEDYIEQFWGTSLPEDPADQQAVLALEKIATGFKGNQPNAAAQPDISEEDQLTAKHLKSLAKRLKNDDEGLEPFAIKLPGLTFEDLVPAPTDKTFTFVKNAGGGTKPKEIWKDDEGNEYLFKPVKESDSFIAYGEALGGHISSLVNPQAPRIWVHKLNGRLGSMQQMLPTKGGILGIPVHELSEADIDAIQREHVVDWLISNHDGHANQFIRVEGGALVGIDKGQAFKYFGKDRLDTDYHPNAQYGEREPIYNELWRAFKEGKLGAYSKAKFGEEGEEIERLKKAIPTVEADLKKATEARAANEQANIAEREAIHDAVGAVFFAENKAGGGVDDTAIRKLFPKGGKEFDAAWAKIVAAAGGLDNVDTTTKALAAMPELVALSEVSLKAMMKGLQEAGKVLPKAAKADLKTLGKLAEVYWEAVQSGNTRAEAWTRTTIAMEGKPGDPQLFPLDYYGHGKDGFRRFLEAAIGAPMHAAADIKNYPYDDHGMSLWNATSKRLRQASTNTASGVLGILHNKHSESEKKKVELANTEVGLSENLTLLRDQLSGLQHTIGENIFLPANDAITLLQEKLSDDQFLAMIRPYAEARFKNRPAGFNAFMDYALQRKQNLANKFNRFFIELTEARARAKASLAKFHDSFSAGDRHTAQKHQKTYAPAAKLSVLELAAIHKYTGSLFSSVNEYLRDPAPIIENGKVKTKWIQAAEIAALIDSGLRKLPPYIGTVRRGQTTSGAERAELRPGKIFTTKPLWSTSKGQGFTSRNTKFIIESKTGRDIQQLSGVPSEQEVLFPTNSQFLITHVEKKGDELYVHATELPDIDFNDL